MPLSSNLPLSVDLLKLVPELAGRAYNNPVKSPHANGDAFF